MKKKLIVAASLVLVVVLIVVGLVACGQAEQQEQEPQNLGAQQTEPVTADPEEIESPEPESSVEPEEPAESKEPVESAEPAESEEPVESAEPAESEEPVEPEDETETEPETEDEPVYTFEDCNETVYVIDSVKFRIGPSEDFDYIGLLSTGMSVTRVGKGTGDAVGWSKIQLEDGNVFYVISSYLSTTKPSTQNSGGSGGGTGGGTPPEGTNPSQSQQEIEDIFKQSGKGTNTADGSSVNSSDDDGFIGSSGGLGAGL